MKMSDYLEKPRHGGERGLGPEEDLFAEVRRIWTSELKPHFDTEREFLLQHGASSGYDRGYITRVLGDHRALEKLVWKSGDGNIQEFTHLLADHIRFKQDYFTYRVGKVLGESQGSFGSENE